MPELRIFISHKMPTDTDIAEAIGSRLALYGGNQVIVTHAGQFRYGEQWRKKIQEELHRTHWLIFLYGSQDDDWGFCLFECGYFRRVMEIDDSRRLITFCRKDDDISDALKEFNAMAISEASVAELLKDIYLNPPWMISPKLPDKILRDTASDIVKAFMGSERVEAHFNVATTVMMELLMDETAKAVLKDNRVPPDVTITGTKGWQRLFGREIDTGGWKWHHLISDWPYGEVYEFLIAKMIYDAYSAHMPKGMYLRAADSDELYRMTLRRYERMAAASKYRFYFTVAPVDLPFDVPSKSGSRARETVLYHLVNLTWNFRRRLVDQLYERLLEVLYMTEPNAATVCGLYDEIERELMQVSAQAIIRGLDSPLVLQRALSGDGQDSQATQELIERLRSWRELRTHICRTNLQDPQALQSIACDLHKMAMQNYYLYRKVASDFSAIAQELSVPIEPPIKCS
jgi:hypothetical protein